MANIKYRRFRVNLAKSLARRPVVWLRHGGLHSNDVFLASYPRSGNTWLRFVLGEALSGKSITFDNVDDVIPELKWHRRAMPLFEGGGRLIKTHEPWRKEYRKAIYIVRDARDAALSQFARSAQMQIVDPDLDEFIETFIQGNVHGYGTWDNHIRTWLNSPLSRSGNLLVVKFEDLRRNPEEILTKMVNFVRAPIAQGQIRAALANNSVEQMRAKEVKSRKLYQSTTEVGRFVRKGAVQGWKNTLTPAQVERFEQAMGAELARMGYVVGSKANSNAAAEELTASR
jgi:hypothetical protein